MDLVPARESRRRECRGFSQKLTILSSFLIAVLTIVPTDLSVLAIPKVQAEEIVWTKESLKDFAATVAKDNGLHVPRFLATIRCESVWNPNAVGDGGKSFGLVQIHLPSHPNVSKEEALNPVFAINFMAEMWKNDRAYLWSCWRKLRSASG